MIAAGVLGHATLLDSLGTLRTVFADLGFCFGAFLLCFRLVVILWVENCRQELVLFFWSGGARVCDGVAVLRSWVGCFSIAFEGVFAMFSVGW